jgi:hypothetical protein
MFLEVIYTTDCQNRSLFLEFKEILRKKAPWEPFMGEGKKGYVGDSPQALA